MFSYSKIFNVNSEKIMYLYIVIDKKYVYKITNIIIMLFNQNMYL